MVITKMNNVLVKHSRILFGLFTGIIIISFVWFFTPGASGNILFGSNPMSPNAVVGKAFDQDITRAELMEAMKDICLVMAVQYNMKPDMGVFGESAKQSAFEVAASLSIARQLGVQVSTAQIGEYLRALPAFQKDGKFSAPAYEKYEKEMLHPYGYNALDLDNAVKSVLTLNALSRLAVADVTVTANEVENFERTMLERYEVKTILFPFEAARKTVKPTETELQNYHKANPSSFQTLPNYKAKLVRFSFKTYLPKVVLTKDAVKKYYDANKSEFTRNGKTEPLSAVSARITAKLKDAEAAKLAMKDARAFREALYDVTADLEPQDYAGAFEELARKKSYPVLETQWFNRESKSVDPLLVDAVLALKERSPITRSVTGSGAAYVAVRTGFQPSRNSEYKEVAAKVRENYIRSRGVVIAKENARNFMLKMNASKNPAAELAALAGSGVVKSVPAFSLSEPPKTDAATILPLAAETMTGKLSRSVDLPDGVFLVFVGKRVQPSAAVLAKEKARFEEQYKQRKSFAVADSFRTWISRNVQNYIDRQNQ